MGMHKCRSIAVVLLKAYAFVRGNIKIPEILHGCIVFYIINGEFWNNQIIITDKFVVKRIKKSLKLLWIFLFFCIFSVKKFMFVISI